MTDLFQILLDALPEALDALTAMAIIGIDGVFRKFNRNKKCHKNSNIIRPNPIKPKTLAYQ